MPSARSVGRGQPRNAQERDAYEREQQSRRYRAAQYLRERLRQDFPEDANPADYLRQEADQDWQDFLQGRWGVSPSAAPPEQPSSEVQEPQVPAQPAPPPERQHPVAPAQPSPAGPPTTPSP